MEKKWQGQCHVIYGCESREGSYPYCKDKGCKSRMVWKDRLELGRVDVTWRQGTTMRDVIKEYTDKVNVLWVHKTIDALIELDEYPLLAPLRHTPDREVLEVIHKHTQEPLQDADVAIRTDVINEITSLDWHRRMGIAIAEIKEFYEGEQAWHKARKITEEKERVEKAMGMLQQILTERGELWVRIL